MISRKRLVLLAAQGFGVGRIPLAPGTFGTLLGLPWTWLLLAAGTPWLYLLGTLLGLGAAVWIADAAEQILGRKDAASIVVDEYAALPLAFFGWFLLWRLGNGRWPAPGVMWQHFNWILSLGVFVLFRLFDIVKPWPIRATQNLWGGLGVVIDDVAAALAAGAVTFLVLSLLTT
jgi:phosphatidylglycerophosphatase A